MLHTPVHIHTWYRCVAWTLRNPKKHSKIWQRIGTVQWHQHKLHAIHRGGKTIEAMIVCFMIHLCPNSCLWQRRHRYFTVSWLQMFEMWYFLQWSCRVWRSYLKTIRAIVSEVLIFVALPLLGEHPWTSSCPIFFCVVVWLHEYLNVPGNSCIYFCYHLVMKLCLVKISSGFFVIYRLGFLSDLEHRVWNADEDSQDGLEFAGVLLFQVQRYTLVTV